MIINKTCPVCLRAYKNNSAICQNCFNEIKKYSYREKCIKCSRALVNNEISICTHCKKINPFFSLAFAAFPYKGDFKDAIKGAKFYDEYHRIKKLSEFIADSFSNMNEDVDLIIYVPTDIKTILKRRYCLSQEIAYCISKKLKLPVYKDFLIKKSNVSKQSLVPFDKRYTNIKGAFFKNPFSFKKISGKNILLVDDVLTTGSTLSECSGVLKKLGAKDIYAVALAYGSSNS